MLRKTTVILTGSAPVTVASMRPQRNAAENVLGPQPTANPRMLQ